VTEVKLLIKIGYIS